MTFVSPSLVLRTTAPSAGPPGMFVLMVTVTNPLLSLTVYEIGSNQTSISGEVGGRGVGEIATRRNSRQSKRRNARSGRQRTKNGWY